MGGYGGSRGGGFSEQYRCYSVAMMQGNERQNVNHGGKSNVFPICFGGCTCVLGGDKFVWRPLIS